MIELSGTNLRLAAESYYVSWYYWKSKNRWYHNIMEKFGHLWVYNLKTDKSQRVAACEVVGGFRWGNDWTKESNTKDLSQVISRQLPPESGQCESSMSPKILTKLSLTLHLIPKVTIGFFKKTYIINSNSRFIVRFLSSKPRLNMIEG